MKEYNSFFPFITILHDTYLVWKLVTEINIFDVWLRVNFKGLSRVIWDNISNYHSNNIWPRRSNITFLSAEQLGTKNTIIQLI